MKKIIWSLIYITLSTISVSAQENKPQVINHTRTEIPLKIAVKSLKADLSIVNFYLNKKSSLPIKKNIGDENKVIILVEKISKDEYVISKWRFKNSYLSLRLSITKTDIVVDQHYSNLSLIGENYFTNKDGSILVSDNIRVLEDLTELQLLLRGIVVLYNNNELPVTINTMPTAVQKT